MPAAGSWQAPVARMVTAITAMTSAASLKRWVADLTLAGGFDGCPRVRGLGGRPPRAGVGGQAPLASQPAPTPNSQTDKVLLFPH